MGDPQAFLREVGEGDDYLLQGAHGDKVPLQVLPVPNHYLRLPPSNLASAVLELGELYYAHAQDLERGTQVAATFDDAVRLRGYSQSLTHGSANRPYTCQRQNLKLDPSTEAQEVL
ncbi:hypothetical protein [Pseudomonas sp. LP_7_YM]|uniref:hypothetical protein n=1 Tax=Pseudomonas sp. LP_7_YM TaxID=2485137 RepID=UPI0010604D5C|nr:hypothetical protein [Pseudomonas sp. LP_7_YM]